MSEKINIAELEEDLESTFGESRRTTDDNIRYMIHLLEENTKEGKINLDYPEPSMQAVCVTLVAIYKYADMPWEKLAETKPAIKRTFTYVVINSKGNMDKVESLLHQAYFKIGNRKMSTIVMMVIKALKMLAKEDRPTRLIDHISEPSRYDAISYGLHKMIREGQDKDAAICILAAIEDGLLVADTPRSVLVEEFKLNKSGFNKYYSKFQHEGQPLKSDEPRILSLKKANYKASLRALIGYEVKEGGGLKFHSRGLKRRNFVTIAIAYIRELLDKEFLDSLFSK